jgi:hypothetical protein
MLVGLTGDLELASPYSYFAVVYLRQRRKILADYGVQVE